MSTPTSPTPTPTPTSTSPSSAASFIGNNEDILTEILSHLPVKPILTLKSISKQFHSLISSPSFSLLHSLRHPHPHPSALLLLLHQDHHPFSTFTFVSFSYSRHISYPFPISDIVQSSNGLLLSLPTNSHSHLLVSNPTTRLTTRISTPPQTQTQTQTHLVGVSLAFDPSRWAHYYVVGVSKHDHNQNKFLMHVYCSGTRRWRDFTCVCQDVPFDVEFDRGVYWNGRVFWLSRTGWTVFYDVQNEFIGKLVLPKVFEQGIYLERFRYFGESCGHLHLVEIRTNCVREFHVLELVERDGGELVWVMVYKADLDLVGFGFEDVMFQDGVDRFGRQLRFYAFSIIAVFRRGDGDDEDGDGDVLVLSIPGKVISYSFQSKVSRLLCNVPDESDKWFPFRGYNAFQFIQSLYCP